MDPSSDPWQVDPASYPRGESAQARLRFLLRYAALAPSSHNTQPWLFRIRDDAVFVYADRTRALPVADPDDRELTISCGAALELLRLAIRRFGHLDVTTLFPDPKDEDLLAKVRLGDAREPTAEETRMFEAMGRRRTNRQPFENRPIPDALVLALTNAAALEGVWLEAVRGESKRGAVAELVAVGDRMQAADPSFRRELAAWVHPNRSRSRDGLPGYAFGMGDLVSYAGPLVLRTFDWGRGKAARDHEIAIGSPLLAVLGTELDAPVAWLQTGMALARVLLLAAAEGVSASYLNQPIEVRELRPKLREILGRPGEPQLLLRMGYGATGNHTPRRPVDDVLLP